MKFSIATNLSVTAISDRRNDRSASRYCRARVDSLSPVSSPSHSAGRNACPTKLQLARLPKREQTIKRMDGPHYESRSKEKARATWVLSLLTNGAGAGDMFLKCLWISGIKHFSRAGD